MTYIHTPTGQVVEAVQWKKTNFKEIREITDRQVHNAGHGHLILRINKTSWVIYIGEWVIKTPDGQFHIHSNRYFEGHYWEVTK